MRYSRLFGKTLRDKPRNAEAISHQLLLRAGFLKTAASGAMFNLLPLAGIVLERMRAALAVELQRSGAQPLMLPSGRRSTSTEASRDLRLQRRDAGLEYPWAEQHEAALGLLEGNLNLSHRELSLTLSAERWASRDGARVNWGLLFAPEFLLNGAYLFCASGPELEATAEIVETAYRAFALRIGLEASWLRSHDGVTGEMLIATELPGRRLLACDRCGRQADIDEAVSRVPEWPQDDAPGEMRAVHGPGLINVEPLSDFLGIPVHQTTKTLLFQTGDRFVAACVAGVYDVSEKKLARLLGVRTLSLAPADVVRSLTQSEVGYAGPIGLPESVEVVWDLSTEHRINFEAGANRTDHHLINVNFERDLIRPARFFDIRVSRPSERCVDCHIGSLTERKAIALAHVSRVGSLYAARLGAAFLDSDRATKPVEIGCAGIDLTACLAAVVEQRHDARGIEWPPSIAPFAAQLISLPPAEESAAHWYERLRAARIDVLWDDRSESAGVKFRDADLIGIPVRLVVSKRTGDKLEWKPRDVQEGELITGEEAIERLGGAGILASTRAIA